MDDAENGKFNIIIVYNNDRLARNPIEHLYLREFFSQHNVTVILSGPRTLYDNGELVPQLLKDGMTKFESDATRDRTKDNYKYKIENGKWIGGKVPFGYCYDKDKKEITIKPEKIGFVKLTFKLYREGLGFKSIAAALNEEKNNDLEWTKEKVKSIIINPFYSGYLSMNKRNKTSHNSINDRKDWILGKSKDIPVVISFEEWEYCMSMYEKKKKEIVSPNYLSSQYLLKDILYCRECEVPLKPKNQSTKSLKGDEHKKRVYVCPPCRDNELRKYKIRIDVEEIEKYVIYFILNLLQNHNHYGDPVNLHKEVIKSATKELVEYDLEIENLKNVINKYLIEKEKVENEIKKVMSENDHDSILYSLQVYKQQTSKKIKLNRLKIDEILKKKEFTELIMSDFSLWQNMNNGLYGNGTKNSMRRLIIHLFNKIEVSLSNESKDLWETNKNEHQGRIIENQYNLYIHGKVNLETKYFLDIEVD
ncbi:recombinase family protein [Peribacillus frigoritolerans]|nr:recombinase family protein [Peribacillus frigoritolerans]